MTDCPKGAALLLKQLLDDKKTQGLAWWEVKDNSVAYLLSEGLLEHRHTEPVCFYVPAEISGIYNILVEAGGWIKTEDLIKKSKEKNLEHPLPSLKKLKQFGIISVNKIDACISIVN